MKNTAGISKEYTEDFVLDETKLRKLADVLTQHAAKKNSAHIQFQFFVYRNDDSYFETAKIEDVFQDDNAKGKEIRAIIVSLLDTEKNKEKTDKDEVLCKIRFNTQGDTRVDFSVSDENRDWCFLLADDVDAQIKRTIKKTRWTWLTKSPLIDMGLIWIILLIPLTPVDGYATILKCGGRGIQKTCESSGRSFQRARHAWNIWFNADGRMGLFVQRAPARRLG